MDVHTIKVVVSTPRWSPLSPNKQQATTNNVERVSAFFMLITTHHFNCNSALLQKGSCKERGLDYLGMSHHPWLMLVAIVAVATVSLAAPEVVFEASRVIQFDRIADAKTHNEFGSRSTLIRGKLQLASTDTDLSMISSDVTSSVVLVTGKAEASSAFLEAITSLRPQAVVFFGSTLGIEATRFLTQQSFGIALYAVSGDSYNSTLLLDSIVPAVQRSKFDELFVSLGDAKNDIPTAAPVPEAVAVVAQLEPKGHKKSTTNGGDKKRIRRMLLSSQFDAIGVTPFATFGDLSGAAAVCEIHRLLGNSSSKDTSFAVHSLLSNHGRFNYLGTRKWISTHQALLVDTYDFAVSVDSLLSGENVLYVHSVARLDDEDSNSAISPFLRFLKEEATARSVELRFVPKKTNATHHDVRFEHEVFAHKKLTAVTISAVQEHSLDQLMRLASASPISVPADRVTRAALFTEMIAAAVARYLQTTIADLRVPQAEFEGLISFGATKSGALSPYSAMGQGAVTSLVDRRLRIRREDQTMSSVTTVKKFPVTEIPSLQVFGPFSGFLKVYVSKIMPFEIAITAAVGLYVITFAVTLFGFERAMLLLSGVKMSS